jgi:PAS domain S-box-containing protein
MSTRRDDPRAIRPDDFVVGGGEMGALIRAMDWSKTPLGPIDRWPQSLRSAVSILLPSRAQIALFWGEELITLYNDAYRPVFGGKHPGALGKPVREAWGELWLTVLKALFDNVLASGEAFWAQDRPFFLERHGYLEETYFDVSYDPVRDESGRVGGVFCIVSETTRRVVGDRRLRALRDLGNISQHARAVAEVHPAVAGVLSRFAEDVPFALLYTTEESGAGARLVMHLGAQAGSLAAPEHLPADAGPSWPMPDDVAVLADEQLGPFGALQAGPWPEPIRQAVVLPFAAPGQPSQGYLVAGISPRRELDDDYLDFLRLVVSNISSALASARRSEDERKRVEMLAELDRAKTTFFSNVSHEFRTPLTLMLGPLEEALHRSTLDGGDRAELMIAHRNGLRLLKLVNSLLDFSRVEAGRIQAIYEPTDLATLTADLASSFRSACERAHLRLRVDCPPLPEPVYVDRDMWEKIVLNLLSNAFKFTFEGEILVRVSVVDGGVELTVRDTGVGVPKSELPRLFERFYRIEGQKSRTHEGSGIGLALVHELVKLHGGAIRAESTPGVGTALTVRVPLGTAHLPAECIGAERGFASTSVRADAYVEEALRWLPESARSLSDVVECIDALDEVPSMHGDAHGGARILLADDNADMRAYVHRLLGPYWDVQTVADGQAALEAIRAHRPDLVIADIMMPRLDGFGLLRAIREDAQLRDLPVMMLSARAGEEAKIAGLDVGADEYLVKPFSARELRARVRSQLALSHARAQIAQERSRSREREAMARKVAEVQREDFESLFMQAANPFVILRGPHHVVELANPATCRVWGRTPEQVIGKPLLDALPELRGQPFEALLHQVFTTGVPYEAREVPAKLDHGDGRLETVYFNFVYSPLRDVRGGIQGILVNSFDVTQEVVARNELDALRTAAESANRMKDEFLAMLGHELRNPLSPMSTALQVMRLRGKSSREQDILERQVTHLTRLVDDLLDVSRITRGKVELRKRPLEVADTVLRAVEVTSPVLESRRHHLEVDVARAGLAVEADPDRLAQILSNLLNNAAKYSDAGSRIRISARRHGERVEVSVSDEGIGIEPGMIDQVFDLFFQQPQSIDRSRGGLGLGLAIVRNLAELHGGTVSARSEGLGKGSEFTVSFPAIEHAAEPQASVAMPDASIRTRAPSKRILIVDDNADAASTLKDALVSLGHVVTTASDGPAALEVVGAFQPDIALVDIGLPVMDGYDLAQQLRQIPKLSAGLKLIAVTGYGLEADHKRSSSAGFVAHLVKPVDLAVLASYCK